MGTRDRWSLQTPGSSGTSVEFLPNLIVQFHSVQAAQTYTLPADKLLQAIAYAHARHVLYFAGYALSAAVLIAIIYFRIAPRLRAQGGIIVIAAVYAISTVFDLVPEQCAHALSLEYGLSIQPWPGWFLDWLKAQAVAFPLTILLLLGFYFLLRRSPKRWWLYSWVAAVLFTVFATWIEPFVFEPMFNDFKPLASTHPELIQPVERILQRAGVSIPAGRLFEMRASSKTNVLNAYVSGFGSSKRVVLYDTIIRKEPQPALMTTFGHELGHYVLGHIPRSIAFGSAALLFGFFLTYLLIRAFIQRWGARLDIRDAADWASLPVFALVLIVLSFFSEPIANAYSRAQEHAADVYSLEVTHGIVPNAGQAAAEAFQIEGETDLDPPHPNSFIVFWLYTHPPTSERYRFALEYDPWVRGEQPRYVR